MNQRLFLRNWGALVGSNLIAQAFGMLAIFRIARVLLPSGFGFFNLTLTVAAFGSVAVSLGLRNVIIRECARSRDLSGQIVVAAAVIQGACLPLAVVGVFLYWGSSTSGVAAPLNIAAVVLLLALTAWDLIESVSFGHERMEYSAVITLSGSILWVTATWSVPEEWITSNTVTISYVALQFGKAIVYGILGVRKRFLGPGIRYWRAAIGPMLRNGLPFYWLSILTAATNLLPILFLAERSGESQVGLYNVGYRLIGPMQMVMGTALAVIYPSLSQVSLNNGPKLFQVVRSALYGMTLLGTACATCVTLFRYDVVDLLFGSAYRLSADALAFQVWYGVLFSLLSLMGTVLAAMDRQLLLAGLSTCYAIVSLPILWWGAGHGATGLAMAIVSGAVVNFSYHWVIFQRALPHRIRKQDVAVLVLILVAGVGVGVMLPGDASSLVRASVVIAMLMGVGWWTIQVVSARAYLDSDRS
jgi:PST family polysaccharide transporter